MTDCDIAWTSVARFQIFSCCCLSRWRARSNPFKMEDFRTLIVQKKFSDRICVHYSWTLILSASICSQNNHRWLFCSIKKDTVEAREATVVVEGPENKRAIFFYLKDSIIWNSTYSQSPKFFDPIAYNPTLLPVKTAPESWSWGSLKIIRSKWVG